MPFSRYCFSLCLLAVPALSQVKSFDLKAIDKQVDPCTDFYQYACGSWVSGNKIPDDQSSWGRFTELYERNQHLLRDVLETASAKKDATGIDQKIGAYYGACMDEAAIEKRGTEPIKPVLAEIAALKSKDELIDEIVKLHQIGTNPLFNFASTQDYKNSDEVIAEADQGGLGMPDRDYYLKDDAKSVDLRAKYIAHIQRMFELAGNSPEGAAAKAKSVMAIETALAQGSMDRVLRRDPANTYHRLSTADFAKLAPAWHLDRYLQKIGAPQQPTLNVANPDFFKAANAELEAASLDDWKTYLAWHYLKNSAPMLPKAFADESFNFFSKALRGTKEQRARWKRCVTYTDADLGEALGEKYVQSTYGKESKERTLEMVKALEKALERDINTLDWMTPKTKQNALLKLHAISNKIGYPEDWRKYNFEVKAGDALGNSQRANRFEFQRILNKIGKPVDKKEWQMTPPTVNAYYDPQNNNINFPAGILQPPFYDVGVDKAVNFGGIGAVIGHELTHGFDDQGRQFDAKGNMQDWWTPEDAKAFDQRAQCVINQYGNYSAVEDVKLNGKLTLGENVADNGGLRIAYMALLDTLTAKERAQKIDDFTPDQRFFIGFAQVWCTNDRPEVARLRALTDPHSPGKYRVNGTLSNMPEFQKAFGCKAGQPMVSGNACRVW